MTARNAKRIRLTVSGADGVAYQAWPVTFGIPFADGTLRRDRAVRVVDATDRAIPIQTQCLATWDRDLKYVRWLLLDMQADLAPGQTQSFFLEYGAEQPPPEPEQPVLVERCGDHLVIDTGSMKLEMRTSFAPWKQPHYPDVFAHGWVRSDDGWRDMFRGNPGPFLYMVDQAGAVYDFFTAGPAPRVSVEEYGPLRACICVRGYHGREGGGRFCPYILRIHLFAGKSDMRIHHTFIYDQDPYAVELAAIGMQFPLALGDNLRAAVGGAEHPHWATHWENLQFLQSDDRQYTVRLDDHAFGSGEKTLGWGSLNGDLGGMVTVIRNAWQEYPKGIGLTPEGMDVQIWPESYGETLTFTTPWEEPAILFDGTRDEEEVKRRLAAHSTAPLNLKSFGIRNEEELVWVEEMIEKYAPGRPASYNDTGTSNGLGAAKTTEIYVRLRASEITDEEAEGFAGMAQEPLIAPADPVYTCDTGVVGHFYHEGDPQFSEIDAGLDDVLRIVAMEPIPRCRLYGMMRYGNMVCSHGRAGPGLAYLHHKDSDPEKALRYVGCYNNEANDQIMGVWGNFLRTGRRDHFLLADHYGKNAADVDTVHAHPGNPDVLGLMHYHNAHQWSGGPSASHTLLTGLLMGYYFTGNRRIRDVALEAADRLVRTQEPAGLISCRHGILHREFTGPLWTLMEAYQMTWDEKYGDLARRSFNWFLRTIPELGWYPNSVFTRGERGDEAVIQPSCTPPQSATDKYYLFHIGLRLFDSRALRDQIVADADYWVWKKSDPPCNWYTTMACLAYELTHDMVYAAFCKKCLEGSFLEGVEFLRRYDNMNFGAIDLGSTVPRLMRVVAEAMEAAPQALAEAEREWQAKRREIEERPDPERPDRVPGRSLGIVSTEPLP